MEKDVTMRNLMPYCLLLMACLVISGCLLNFKKNKEKTLYGTWRLYDIESHNNKSGPGDPFENAARLKKTVKDGAIFCFFENGEYTEIKADSEVKFGKWKAEEGFKSIQFIDSGRATVPIGMKIESNADNNEMLTLTIKEKHINLIFIKESESLPDFTSDPFYYSNNLWRIKPKKPESLQQLTNRLTNYLKHTALILKAAQDRKQDIVSFEYSQGPIKIYNGAIGIHPYNRVSDTWKNTFYDEVDAKTAYIKYEKYLEKSRYKGAGTGNWIEDDYNILLSMYAELSSPENR